MDKQTVVAFENQPPEDSDRTWHVHEDEDDWGWGIDCERCRGERTGNRYAGTGPRFNIRRLKDQNAGGYTTNELVKETYDEARRTGIDITRAS